MLKCQKSHSLFTTKQAARRSLPNRQASPSMAPVVFIAVQCCECSTMQVKQQKKSSNKWTCVVCNQKQSVRKVFARGFMAKDIRKFVQTFNMSRKSVEEGEQSAYDCEVTFSDPSAEIGNEADQKKKRRVDWSEYIDGDDIRGDEFGAGVKGGESEPNILTEWPEELFKKPNLKGHVYSAVAYKPDFSKRSRNTNYQDSAKNTRSVAIERLSEEKGIHGSSNTQQRQNPSEKGASKWAEYMADNDAEHGCREKTQDFAAGDLDCSYEDDQEVEEDIHPDFL